VLSDTQELRADERLCDKTCSKSWQPTTAAAERQKDFFFEEKVYSYPPSAPNAQHRKDIKGEARA
jgi:hypothetical protein